MSSLADLPELVGFFSYSRRDDQNSEGALTRLRARIYSELRLQLGRELRLWQDTAAIPEGSLWEQEIKSAIAEAAFFVPIVTPSAVGSKHCRVEFTSFLERERELGRSNLIFPLLYVRVPALEREDQWRDDPVLATIGTRQYSDWQDYRHRDLREPEVARKIELFCRNIVEALRQPWLSLEERRAAEAKGRQAEEDEAKRRRDAEVAREGDKRERSAREAEQRLAEEAAREARERDKARRVEAERQRLEALKANLSATASAARFANATHDEGAALYFVGSYLTIVGAFALLGSAAIWYSISRVDVELGAWLSGFAIPVAALGAIGAGFGTMQAKRWARFPGIAICLAITLSAGFVVVMNVIDPVPDKAVWAIMELCFVFNLLAAIACLRVYLFGWKPNAWLNSAMLKRQSAFISSVLLLDAIILLFFFLVALNPNSTFHDDIFVWSGAALIVVGGASFYCVRRFRQLGALD